MDPMNESKFNMWRACIAVIYLDKVVTKEEHDWAIDRIQKLPLTENQRNILQNDLKNGVTLDEVLPKITEKVDLGFLVNNFRILANIDHNFSDVERASFNALEKKVLGGLDLVGIEKQAEEAETKLNSRESKYLDSNSASMFEHTFHQFMKSISR